MTVFAIDPAVLKDTLTLALGDKVKSISLALGEVTVTVKAADYLAVMQILRDAPECKFEQLIDICGVDYSAYRDSEWEGPRYCAVSHLLSVSLNQRVRVRGGRLRLASGGRQRAERVFVLLACRVEVAQRVCMRNPLVRQALQRLRAVGRCG